MARTYEYDAFGVERSPAEGDTNPWRYCGEYFDVETGTVYLRARYYEPGIGRFTSEDPHWNVRNMIYGDDPLRLNEYTVLPSMAAIMQRGNLYIYGLSNPVRWTDSSGHVTEIDVYLYNYEIMSKDDYQTIITLTALYNEYITAGDRIKADAMHYQASLT